LQRNKLQKPFNNHPLKPGLAANKLTELKSSLSGSRRHRKCSVWKPIQ